MKIFNLRLLTLTSMLALAACSSTEKGLYPASDNMPAQNKKIIVSEPSASTASAPAISKRIISTIPGQKAEALYSELAKQKSKVVGDIGKAEALKNKIQSGVAEYNSIVATINSKLQMGTTPANPIMVEKWEAASAKLELINQDIAHLSQISSDMNADLTSLNYILDSVKDTYSLAGAVDEDHERLRDIEDEANKEIVTIKRRVAELTNSLSRQRQYTANEQNNLGLLSLAIRSGKIEAMPRGNMKAHIPASFKAPSSKSAVVKAPSDSVGVNNTKEVRAKIADKPPLMRIKFAKNNVSYNQALYSTVKRVIAKKPDVIFDVVEIMPQQANLVLTNAKAVANELQKIGIPTERINTSGLNSDVEFSEVRIYTK